MVLRTSATSATAHTASSRPIAPPLQSSPVQVPQSSPLQSAFSPRALQSAPAYRGADVAGPYAHRLTAATGDASFADAAAGSALWQLEHMAVGAAQPGMYWNMVTHNMLCLPHRI